MIIPVILAASGAYIFYKYSQLEEDTPNRAAETVVPPQEKKTILQVRPTHQRPETLPPRAYVASTFNPIGPGYTPVADVNPEMAEPEIKSLNIANRFLYG